MMKLPLLGYVPKKYKSLIREKAISRARTRIIVAGGDPSTFSQEDLEVVVREEEDNIKNGVKEKGLLAVLALLGLNFLG
ncbi:MAG: hypothetical protein ACRBEE_14395 [Arenicella sp.]